MSLMRQILLLISVGILLGGCLFVNERGVSTNYYNDCKEYYDATGTYRKDCPKNIVDWPK